MMRRLRSRTIRSAATCCVWRSHACSEGWMPGQQAGASHGEPVGPRALAGQQAGCYSKLGRGSETCCSADPPTRCPQGHVTTARGGLHRATCTHPLFLAGSCHKRARTRTHACSHSAQPTHNAQSRRFAAWSDLQLVHELIPGDHGLVQLCKLLVHLGAQELQLNREIPTSPNRQAATDGPGCSSGSVPVGQRLSMWVGGAELLQEPLLAGLAGPATASRCCFWL